MSTATREKIVVHAVGEQWRWLVLDRQGRVRRHGQCPADAPDWPEQGAVTVLVDAADCMGLSLDLPALSPARLAQALRWAAEEHLSAGAEDEHVVAGPRSASGQQYCVVVGNDRMQDLLSRFSGHELEVMLPDALCLPWREGEVAMGRLGDRVLARWGEWSFGSFEPELLVDMLDGLVPAEAGLVWHGGELPAALADRVGQTRTDALLPTLAVAAAGEPINLLAGPWSPSSAHAARAHWRWAAGLVAVVAVLILALVGVENQMLKRQSGELQLAIDAQFQQAFPDVGRAVRHREQAERELSRLRFGESAGLLELMNRAAPVIDGQDGLRLDGLSYREGLLELSLRAPDVAALDQFEQRLRALDLNASVQSASMDSDGAAGRVRIAGVSQ